MRLLLLCALVSGALATAVSAHARVPRPCGAQPYSYAGIETQRPVYGVSASIAALKVPDVRNGHVAGWVGVSAKGGDGWIQVGLSAFPRGTYSCVLTAGTRVVKRVTFRVT